MVVPPITPSTTFKQYAPGDHTVRKMLLFLKCELTFVKSCLLLKCASVVHFITSMYSLLHSEYCMTFSNLNFLGL